MQKMKHPKEWIGIEQNAMLPYRRYINKSNPGFCGTYVSAALIHYLTKNERNHPIEMSRLLSGLEAIIDRRTLYHGTYPWDVVRGLNELLVDDFYQAHFKYLHRQLIIEQLSQKQPLPVIVGSLSILGSKYRNHWLLAYAFGYNDEGKLFYKCYDNHGKINAVIPASQIGVVIWLGRKKMNDKRI